MNLKLNTVIPVVSNRPSVLFSGGGMVPEAPVGDDPGIRVGYNVSLKTILTVALLISSTFAGIMGIVYNAGQKELNKVQALRRQDDSEKVKVIREKVDSLSGVWYQNIWSLTDSIKDSRLKEQALRALAESRNESIRNEALKRLMFDHLDNPTAKNQ